MKRAVLSTVLAFVLLSLTSEAQAAAGRALPNTFPTLAKCTAAMESGSFRFYEPKYFGLNPNKPANSRDRIVVPLEGDTCLEMLVVGGRQFVAQREGTLFRAQKQPDGSLSLYARDDCGNPVYGVVYPPPPAEPVHAQEPERGLSGSPSLSRDFPSLPDVRRGYAGDEGTSSRQKKGGFCGSKTCKALMIVGAAAGGYAAWRYWPCPPGTVRK